MLIIRVSSDRPEPAAIGRAVAILQSGGIVSYPTDTLYGLAVDPNRDDAVEKLYRAKGRERRFAVPLIACDLDQARVAGQFSTDHLRLARIFWPGPLALVVPAAGVSRRLLGASTTVAIRVPAHPVARALAAAFGSCITATSANPSGRPAAVTAHDVVATLRGGVDAVLDGGRAPGGPPSTIVEITPNGPRLVRAGAVAWERVLKSLE